MSANIEYTWMVDGQPFVSLSLDGKTNVFAAVSLSVMGKRDNIEVWRGTGVIRLPAPTGDFKPYEEVTPDDVVGWAKAQMDKEPQQTTSFYEEQIEDEIKRKEAEAADASKPVQMSFYQPPAPAPQPDEAEGDTETPDEA